MKNGVKIEKILEVASHDPATLSNKETVDISWIHYDPAEKLVRNWVKFTWTYSPPVNKKKRKRYPQPNYVNLMKPYNR